MTTSAARTGLSVGVVAALLILGALGFEYLGRLPPCELCMWQRYPHYAAAALGISVWLAAQAAIVPPSAQRLAAFAVCALVAVSGLIGIYHAGVEWHLWRGPSACTGSAFHVAGTLDLTAPVVMCDHAAWRLFGISMAGYNALISLPVALAGFAMIGRSRG